MAIYSLKSKSLLGPILVVVVGVGTELLIYLMGFHGLFHHESENRERWKLLNKAS